MTAGSNSFPLPDLHEKLAKRLSDLLDKETLTAGELKEVREFLKDNGISATSMPGSPVDKVAKKLPPFPVD